MTQLTLEKQIHEAILLLKDMFTTFEVEEKDPPSDATVESLWIEVMSLRKDIAALKKTKRGVRPKVVDAVKRLVERQDLSQIPIPMMAELIREVFKTYGVPSKCSESSVRWYLSQYSLEWEIVRRKLPPVRVSE